VPPLAVGATASDHPEFLWRVVNLFLKVRVPPEFLWWVVNLLLKVRVPPEFQIRTQKDCPKLYWPPDLQRPNQCLTKAGLVKVLSLPLEKSRRSQRKG